MSTNVHVLHAFSPLCDVNAQCSNIRGSFIAADANLIHISGNGKTCKGLWSVESRDSSVVSSQKGVTLICFANSVCLVIKFFFFVQIVPVT